MELPQQAFVASLSRISKALCSVSNSTRSNETANLLADVLTAEDPADAQFELFLDTSGTKKVSFNGIVTGTSLSATTGDIETVSVSFITNGSITSAV